MSKPNQSFITIDCETEHRESIKGSTFLAYARHIRTRVETNQFLQTLIQRHPEASHLCWAYRMGQQYRFSDGGEPKGTAGQPIYKVIEGQGLDFVVVGVIRYFGGTLLGSGGLMRAYGGTASEALRKAHRCEESPRHRIAVEVLFDQLGTLYRCLDSHGAEERAEDYTERGVRVICQIPSEKVDAFETQLRNATRDQFHLQRF
jgi:uncharacterized YigZ family protein